MSEEQKSLRMMIQYALRTSSIRTNNGSEAFVSSWPCKPSEVAELEKATRTFLFARIQSNIISVNASEHHWTVEARTGDNTEGSNPS